MRSIPIKHHVFAIVCLMTIPMEASAQSAIMGRVTDVTGHGLPGVMVEVAVPVADDPPLEIRDVAVTNSTGWFEATNLRAGSYLVTFSLQGFDTVVSQDVWVGAACVTPLDAGMQELPVRTGLVVTGRSAGGARSVHGAGLRSFREVLAHRSPSSTAQEQPEIAPAVTHDHKTPPLAYPPLSRYEDDACRGSNPLWIDYLSWLPPPRACRLARLPMLRADPFH